MNTHDGSVEVLLSPNEVCLMLGISKSTLWRLETGGEFPRSIRISSRRVGYRSSAVGRWLNGRERAA
ncbi:AlpA family phage regulatory protein [Aestuariibacter salexigens]|uniref:helix-turn-helix transcriptional regulator n=1 Tax=Aestuariibacter salexigens TaxID=226010 RepID=UPI000A071562